MAEPDIRYCTTDDGVRIAYSVRGDGPPLLLCPFFVESFPLADQLAEYRGFVELIEKDRRIARFDMRGTGLSQREAADFSVQAQSLDILAVVRAIGAPSVALFAQGMSGPRAIHFAASYPGLVSHLVLYSTFARPASVLPEGAVRGLAELARSSWPLAAQSMIDLSGRDRPTDLNVRGARVIQESATGDVVASIVEATAATGDVVGLLSSIRAPALVIQATETQLFRVDMGQEIASRLPSSQLRLVQGAHNWLEPDAGRQVARAIDEFLGGGPGREDSVQADAPSPARQAPVFRAILFTDLVGHTQTMQRLGDARGRDLLREHERIMRDAFVRHAGTEIKSDGDSFMVSFASVTAAIECAIDIQRALHARDGEPLQARIGVNAGEPVEEEGDLFGAAVILAARVKDEANAGEILVPESVRGLVAGKGFAFAARGDFVPKGFEDAVRLFEVQWRE